MGPQAENVVATGAARCLAWSACLVASGLGLGTARAETNPRLTGLPANTALDLGPIALPNIPGDPGGDCSSPLGMTSYSRLTYDPVDQVLLMFGGGHATTSRSDVAVFDLATLTWTSAYPPTPLADMVGTNLDATHGRWMSTNHPTARHSYDLLVFAANTRELILMSGNNGMSTCPYPNAPEYPGSTIAHYDPATRQWSYSETPTLGLEAAEYDPVSGRVVAVGPAGLLTYDPISRKMVHHKDVALPGYANNLVYYPPTDRMYTITRGDPVRVFEIRLDRTDFAQSTIGELTVADPPAAPVPGGGSDDTGWAYDAADEIIGGGIGNGVFHALDPRAKAWTHVVMGAAGSLKPTTLSDHALDYDARNGVFLFVTRQGDGHNTWAYRYGPGTPPEGGAAGAGGAPARDGGPGGGPAGRGGAAATAGTGGMVGPGGAGEESPGGGCSCALVTGSDAGEGSLRWLTLALALAAGPLGRRRRRLQGSPSTDARARRAVQNVLRLLVLPALLLGGAARATAAVRSVGPGKTYAAPCAAFAAAADGDVIEIDAAGSYVGDVCSIDRSALTIRGVGAGRAKIDAGGKASAGKGTWVITGRDTVVENVEMLGASVPDHNGAAIRQDGTSLTLRNVYFHDNEEGILTGSDPDSEILVEHSEFARNGNCIDPSGCAHNVYIGHIKKFTFQFSYSHSARDGHEIKTRAAENHILYSRISDEADGTASYSIDVPNAGRTFVIGNLIEQGASTGNNTVVAYGEEGATNATADLYVVSNTFVNDKSSGTYVSVGGGVGTPAVIKNNIFFGSGTVSSQAGAVVAGNFAGADPLLVDRAGYDYRLQPGSPCIDKGVDPGTGGGQSLAPAFEYVHPLQGAPRATVGSAVDIGAYEWGASDGGIAADAGGGGSNGGTIDAGARADAHSPADAVAPADANGLEDAAATAADSGRDSAAGDASGHAAAGSGAGCGCETADIAGPRAGGALLALALLLARHHRRRHGR